MNIANCYGRKFVEFVKNEFFILRMLDFDAFNFLHFKYVRWATGIIKINLFRLFPVAPRISGSISFFVQTY